MGRGKTRSRSLCSLSCHLCDPLSACKCSQREKSGNEAVKTFKEGSTSYQPLDRVVKVLIQVGQFIPVGPRLACEASVSVRFILGASKNPVPRSFFAPKPTETLATQAL